MIRPRAKFHLTLSEAAELVKGRANSSVTFSGVTLRDSEVEPGDLFIAAPGAKFHGAEFIEKAKSRGAVAVLTDTHGATLAHDLPVILVDDVRTAGALIASHLYGNPTQALCSIGITGTNGKTTVSTLLYQIFSAANQKSGLIGTVETRVGDEVLPSIRTTPEAPELQSLAASMLEEGAKNLVMEVSSHALALKRMKGTHFRYVGFTNLSQDHLDFHKDMASYFAAKSELFTPEYAQSGYINIDSPYGAQLLTHCTIPAVSISRSNVTAMWRYSDFHSASSGNEITIQGPDTDTIVKTHTQLLGGFNLDNLLMAVAIAFDWGIGIDQLTTIIPTVTGAPGRLEAINAGQNFTALVDYAHTPDAVTNVLSAAQEFTEGRVIAVLGCGGDRDSSKRPLMGRALFEGSDIAIFTSDNPRSEDPSKILSQMSEGITLSEPSQVCEDRAAAIARAVEIAEAGDTVLILGKGHETGQDIAGKISAFDDRAELTRAIKESSGNRR